nr:katanin p80 WD40 containing subunit B1 [Hymenolepis microstoma]
MQRKAWKLQEFVAHTPGTVTTLTLGRKSARVMATGGEDRRVKLWAVGKPTCIMSLSGHTSSIDAAQFSPDEDCIAAGSLSGSIRVWDLEEAKLARALTGHSASVQSLDFHPHGNFIASGSADATVKLWDVSRKGCINTFRGHTGSVNMVRFSPDGNWIISAGDDGRVKVWDLAAGKQLAELSGHTAPVTSIAYHPTVLLLASASADRTVRIFDLETFSQVAVSGIELAASAIRRIAFHPEGQCLYVGTTEQLKIYHYEIMSCLETVQVGWRGGGGLVDMAVAPAFNQLVGASVTNSAVTTYIADIKSCVPFTSPSSPTYGDARISDSNLPVGILTTSSVGSSSSDEPIPSQLSRCKSEMRRPGAASVRKSFSLRGESNKPCVVPDDSSKSSSAMALDIASESDDPRPVIDDLATYNRVFKPKRAIRRSPTRVSASTTRAVGQQQVPATQSVSSAQPPQKLFLEEDVDVEEEDDAPFSPPPAAPNVIPDTEKTLIPAAAGDDKVQISDFLPQSAAPRNPANSDSFSGIWNMMSGNSSSNDKTISKVIAQPLVRSTNNHTTAPSSKEISTTSVGCRGGSSGEAATLQRLRTPHDAFVSVLVARQKSLTTVRMLWPRENFKACVESAILMQDQAVFVDVLRVLLVYSKQWSLDLVALLLPQLSKLVWSKYPIYVETTCQAVRIILKNFANLIRQTINVDCAIGVDISREERKAKCQTCITHLEAIRSAFEIKEVVAKAGQYGPEVFALFSLLQ